ncbi:lipopolysaccharide biosynthesis protein [Ornithinimicrobium faecis]|nr:oligosaccharide flippase family protein [Ornithinimicrobium sp. HY1793]
MRVGSGAAGGRIITLGAMLLAAGILGPSDFGRFSLILATAQMLGMFATLGLARGLVRLLPDREATPGDRRQLWVWSCLPATVISALLALLVLALPEAGRLIGLPTDSAWHQVGLGLWLFGFTLSSLGQAGLIGSGRQDKAAIWIVVRSICFATTVLIGSFFFAPQFLVLACGLAELVVAGALLLLVNASITSDTAGSLSRAGLTSKLLRNGGPGWLADLSSQFGIWATLYLLTQSAWGPALAGIFALGQRAFVAVTMLSRQVSLSFVPILVHARGRDHASWVRASRRTLRYSLGIGSAVALPVLLLFLVSGPLMGEYGDHRTPLMAMAALGVLASWNTGMGVVAQTGGRLTRWGVSDALAAASTVTVTALLMDDLGLWAAVLGFGAGHLLRSLVLAPAVPLRSAP